MFFEHNNGIAQKRQALCAKFLSENERQLIFTDKNFTHMKTFADVNYNCLCTIKELA